MMADALRTAFALAILFLQDVFAKFVQSSWNELWEHIFEAVVKAEMDWKESGSGAKKKDQVVSEIMAWLQSKVSLSFIQRVIANFIVSKMADALIEAINEKLGHEWIKSAEEFKKKLEDLLPIV